jgi:sulfate permease, SulP family
MKGTFRPVLRSALRGYRSQDFTKDLTAGIIVGIVALPLAIAFAIASGVSPDRGLITAVVAGFLISAIGGPTGAFVVIISGIIAVHGLGGLLIATMMAGVLLVLMGIARLGSIIKIIPHPVIVGFTSGIAVVIFSTQIKEALGLSMAEVPSDVAEKWIAYVRHLPTIDWATTATMVGSLLVMVIWPRITHRIPGPLVALVAATTVVHALDLSVATIGTRFGDIAAALPAPVFPTIDMATIRSLIGPAFTIAMLAAIESLLSAVVADGMIGSRHRSNTELIAQGIANIVTPLFGGIPATGAIARTATNVKQGARTPIAGIVHALVVLAMMLLLGRIALLIPMPTLAAILIVVSYNMSEWRTFRALLRSPRSDVVVLLLTFATTVFVDLTVAVTAGLILSLLFFMQRMASVTKVGIVREMTDDEAPEDISVLAIPSGVEVYEIDGPLFFGAAYKFEEAMSVVEAHPRVRIVRMRRVPAIDATGLHALAEVARASRRHGTTLLIAEIHAQPMVAFEQSDVLHVIGREQVYATLDDAMARAREIIAS